MHDLLTIDHSEIGVLLDELRAALDAGDAAQSFAKLDLFWARLAMHIRAEHLHLFPAILDSGNFHEQSAESGVPSHETVRRTIERLRADHDFLMHELAAAIKQMRALQTKNPASLPEEIAVVREKIAEVAQRLETHNDLEEAEVYRWADALFDPSERTNLNRRMKKELDNLPPRFADH